MRVLLIFLLLTGCGVGERVTFSSEMTSREATSEAFRRYMNAPMPRWFAVSRDGLHYASAVCFDDCFLDREYVMNACKRRAQRSCILYAFGRKIVWRGSSPF